VALETTLSYDDEPVEIVDAAGRPLAVIPAAAAHRQSLPHKAVLALFFDRETRIVLTKRKPSAQAYPGRWDLPGRGHVRPGEAFLDAAKRLAEPLFPGRCGQFRFACALPATRDTAFEALCVFCCRLAEIPLTLESLPPKEELLAVNADEMTALAADFRELFTPEVVNAFESGWLFDDQGAPPPGPPAGG